MTKSLSQFHTPLCGLIRVNLLQGSSADPQLIQQQCVFTAGGWAIDIPGKREGAGPWAAQRGDHPGTDALLRPTTCPPENLWPVSARESWF